jgi:hypothetical protein
MSQFRLPLSERDRGWVDLRERLARAAREIHFVAVSSEAMNGAVLLVIAGNLADLAMSIPMSPAPIGLVDASTLIATQVLHHRGRASDIAVAAKE